MHKAMKKTMEKAIEKAMKRGKLMQNGLIRVMTASPSIRVADCHFNAGNIIEIARKAETQDVQLLVTPELGITGYTCADLFLQTKLLEEATNALLHICEQTKTLEMILLVGLPLLYRSKLYNCAAVLHKGNILGFVPKSNLPNYGEFYEKRQFTSGFAETQIIETGAFRGVPIGAGQLFQCSNLPEFILGVEICEDLWVPLPPSTHLAAAGATIIANLSASDETIGKQEYRRSLVSGQSAQQMCAYLYADATRGESTTDMVFAGHNLIAENGTILAESKLFEETSSVIAEIDLQRLTHERCRVNTYVVKEPVEYRSTYFELAKKEISFSRTISPFPFIPADSKMRDNRCETIFSIQACGLAKRIEHTNTKKLILGISGGLDSTLALLVSARALQMLNRPMSDILAITMPCFGTTNRTRSNAEKISMAVGATFKTIDITNMVRTHFADIGHEESKQDVVYENAQARVRTLVLMDIANAENGLVVGTGDLSELALGWATYNGDHMSMYAVNASVPKTLIRHIVAYEASIHSDWRNVLTDILETPVSPELLPAQDGNISQKTEHIVGPYELHDFFLYYAIRWGFAPRKVLMYALNAFRDKYAREEIVKWLEVFYRRFFSQQFKRSCLPDGPKVGSVSLSPRGDWRMPTDTVAGAWVEEVVGLK